MTGDWPKRAFPDHARNHEKSEKNHDKHTDRGLETDAADNQKTENNHGKQNHYFHAGHGHAHHTNQPTDTHHADERERKLPDSPAGQLRRPNADREHRQEMIPTVQRMIEAVTPATHCVAAGVGLNQ